MKVSASRSTRGFSLIELLVVVSIIGILVGLVLPAVQAAPTRHGTVPVRNNLKQIGLGLHGYLGIHNSFPPGSITYQESPQDCSTTPRGHGLFTLILGSMEQMPVYNAINFSFASTGWHRFGGRGQQHGLRRTNQHLYLSDRLTPNAIHQ